MDSRWGHIPTGKKLPIDKAPIIIDDNISSIVSKLKPAGKPLNFHCFPDQDGKIPLSCV
jgi:hypothetical protein